MEDLTRVVLPSLIQTKPKEKAPVRIKRKKKKKKITVLPKSAGKRKAEQPSAPSPSAQPTDVDVEREELKRSKTLEDIEEEGMATHVDELQAREELMREKNASLVSEQEAQTSIIAELRAQVAQKDEELAQKDKALAESKEECDAWEAEAHRILNEANDMIETQNLEEETRANMVNSLKNKLATLGQRYNKLLSKYKGVVEDAEELEVALDEHEYLAKRQERKLEALKVCRTDVALTEQASIIMLEASEAKCIAAIAAIDELRKVNTATKKRCERAERDAKISQEETAALKAENGALLRKIQILDRGTKVSLSTSSDDSLELSKAKSALTNSEFLRISAETDRDAAQKDLKLLESNVKSITAVRDEALAARDAANALNEKLIKTISKKNKRLEEYRVTAGGFQEKLKELQARSNERHAQAKKNIEEGFEGEIKRLKGEMVRLELEKIDFESRYKDVCKELDALRQDHGDVEKLKEGISALEKAYGEVVEKNKKWKDVNDAVVAKNAQWKQSEVAWVATQARLEDELHSYSQRCMVLEHELSQKSPVAAPTSTTALEEYIKYIESLAGAFTVTLGEAIDTLHSMDFSPGPLLLKAFQDFNEFRENITKLIGMRNRGVWDDALYQKMAQYVNADFSGDSEQLFNGRPCVISNIYGVTLAALAALKAGHSDLRATMTAIQMQLQGAMVMIKDGASVQK